MKQDRSFFAAWGLTVILALGLLCYQGAWGTVGAPLLEEKPGQTLTGKVKAIRAASSVTLSGVSEEGVFLTGISQASRDITAGISVFLTQPGVGANLFIYNEDDTKVSGNTLYVHFLGTSTYVLSDIACTPGVSKYVLSGTTLQRTLTMWTSQVSKWTVRTNGNPTVDWD